MKPISASAGDAAGRAASPFCIRIVEASNTAELMAAARLLQEYAGALGLDISHKGDFANEIASLPGPYASPEGSLLLAFRGNIPVGVVGLQLVPLTALIPGAGAERAGEMKRLYVRPEYRGTGIGRMLVIRTESEAKRRGYESLVLTTSAELFPKAKELYESSGYRPATPYRNDMLWPGVLWMRKDL